MVHDRIEQTISKRIENDFKFTFDDFEVNLFSKNVKLIGFNLLLFDQTDTVGYFKGDLSIQVRGWRNIIFDEQKIIKKIDLTEADLYYAKDHPLTMKSKNGDENQKVAISNVTLKGKMDFANKHEKQEGKLSTDFNIAATLNYNKEYEFSVDSLIKQITSFEVTKLHYFLPDGFYQLMVKEITFTSFEEIALKQVTINPLDTKEVFSRRKEVATDMINITIDSILFKEFERPLDNRIYVDQIHLFQPNIDVYKDKNYPKSEEYKALLADLLRELKTPVFVKNIEIDNMFIKYTELANDAKEPGELFFSEANAKISNITNVKDSLEHLQNVMIEVQAKFYGEGALEASINYDLLSESGQYGVKGSLGSMDIAEVNAIVSKLVPIKVASGQLEDLHFDFSGTRLHSDGEMRFKYSNLKIELLEVDYLNNDFTQNLVSNIGNRALRNSNPSENGIFKVGEIDQDRDNTKSMFNYWWISLQSGFLSTLGVKAEKYKVDYKTGESARYSDKKESDDE